MNFFRASKVSNLPPSGNIFCRDCFRNKSVCDNHTDVYNNLNCDVRPCETCERLLKESKNLACKEFCNLLSILDQESAYQKFGEQISIPFSHSSLTKVFLNLNEFCHIQDAGHPPKTGKQLLRENKF